MLERWFVFVLALVGKAFSCWRKAFSWVRRFRAFVLALVGKALFQHFGVQLLSGIFGKKTA